MRFRTQFRITLILFSITLLLIAVSTTVTLQMAESSRRQENLAQIIAQGASDLSYLSNDYVIYHEPQQLSRWQSKFASFSNDVGNLSVSNPDQQVLVNHIKLSRMHIKEVFDSISSILSVLEHNTSETLETFQVSWSRMAVQTRGLTSDATQLAELLHTEADQLNNTTIALVFATIGSFCAFLVAVYIQTFRRTLRSIATLQDGVAVVGSGDLGFKIEEDMNDEIGELSRSFNLMTKNLKAVTASKAELENEIAERKSLQRKLEDSAVQLEEYANRMEQLANERAKKLQDTERLAAIGATAGMVGHDIRNPLQSIIGDLYLANADTCSLPPGEERQNILESLGAIQKSVEYINKIVADLQDFARPLSPHREVTNVSIIVEELLTKNGLPENIKIVVHVAKEVHAITADPIFVKRIISNLMNNAAQAMPNGGTLTISAYIQGSDAVLTVSDTGIGIPEDVKHRLFQPLFTTKSKGQGFGLSVVKRMTEALGGTVNFKSEQGAGTTFIITLPQSL